MKRVRDDVDRVGVLCTTSLTTDSQSDHVCLPRCQAPLASGFRRNDGGCAQHPLGLTWGLLVIPCVRCADGMGLAGYFVDDVDEGLVAG